MKRVFLVSLNGIGVAGEYTVIGFLSSNNRDVLAAYIKKHYDLILQDQLPNEFGDPNDYHWEYATDSSYVNIHVDVCYNLDENEDE